MLILGFLCFIGHHLRLNLNQSAVAGGYNYIASTLNKNFTTVRIFLSLLFYRADWFYYSLLLEKLQYQQSVNKMEAICIEI